MIVLDGDYTQTGLLAIRVNEARALQPFSGHGDENVYLIEEDIQVLAASYAPLALDTPHPTLADFYLVADGLNPSMQGGTVRQFTRLWGKIPAQRIEGSTIAWSIPGLARGGTNAIIGIESVSAPAGGLVDIITSTAHGLFAGDKVFFYFQQSQSVYKPESIYPALVVAAPFANQIQVYATGTGAFFTDAISLQKAGLGRAPRTKAVPCDVVYDYFLPGVSPGIPTKESIPILTPPAVYDGNNQLVDPPDYSAETTPTNTDYLTQVAAGSMIVSQDSSLARWQGNIYERITRQVRAQ